MNTPSTVEAIRVLLAEGPFKRVEGELALSQLAADRAPPLALPAAFVISESESVSDAAQGSNIYEQIVSETIGVVIVVAADALRRGQAAASLDALRAFVLDQLFAASPLPGLSRPLAYQGAQLIGLSGGRVSRILRFRAISRIRRTGAF
ncbi:MAG: hypothetical protein SNJ79_01365 [Sphingomonadaceae bacterium]